MAGEAMGDVVNGHHHARRAQAARGRIRVNAAAADGVRELRTAAELVREADWPHLAARARAALLAPYAPLMARQHASTSDQHTIQRDAAEDAALQTWVADLVAERMQRSAVDLVRTWLEDSAPNTHLYVASASGRGRTSVVATLARRAMSRLPSVPDYCYVPDPTALAHCWLLALPAGTGVPFAEGLTNALRTLLHNWEKPRERMRLSSEEEPDETVLRARLVSTTLAAFADLAPDVARPYLERLAAALAALCANYIPPSISEIDVPAGRIQPPTLDPASAAALPLVNGVAATADAAAHPPVIVGSLARMDLTRSLLRANGGVLVLLAADFVDRDQVTSELATLRAVLRAGVVYARGAGEPGIPITTRVALIGTYGPYRVLERAEDFVRLFRYKVQFEDNINWTPESEAAYAAVLAYTAKRYHLPAFDPTAVGRLVEEGSRRASRYHRGYLSTNLLVLRDLAVEAGRLAQARAAIAAAGAAANGATPVAIKAGAARTARPVATRRPARPALAAVPTIAHATTAADVDAALAARQQRQGEPGRGVRESLLRNHDLVPTAGSAVGEINGLVVTTSLPAEGRFGVPFRVSVAVSPGSERLVDIEREADSADATHISGALTMAGYLAWRYGHQRPISVVARLRFEQEHNYTSGPSASAAELFALLSALSGVPIRRSLAVTGAVGQHGDLQIIGGVNEKIEGFWEICRARREQGEQPEGAYGVLLPLANVDDLMLRPPIIASIVEEGWFHIWPIADIDAGLPLLTGLPAADIHARVDQQLQKFYELTK